MEHVCRIGSNCCGRNCLKGLQACFACGCVGLYVFLVYVFV